MIPNFASHVKKKSLLQIGVSYAASNTNQQGVRRYQFGLVQLPWEYQTSKILSKQQTIISLQIERTPPPEAHTIPTISSPMKSRQVGLWNHLPGCHLFSCCNPSRRQKSQRLGFPQRWVGLKPPFPLIISCKCKRMAGGVAA